MARLRVHLARPALRARRDKLPTVPAVASGPTHAGASMLGTPRRLALGSAVAAATAVVAAGALAFGGTGSAAQPRQHRHVAAGATPAAPSAGTDGAALAGGVLAAGPGRPGTGLIGFGGGAVAAVAVPRAPVADLTPPSALAAGGIPLTALTAYKRAAATEAAKNPACHLPWPLLAGIGRVESNHGRFAGAVLHASGVSTPRIIGIPLNGNGTALIGDTDHGRLDGDTVYDRAVGPMQFIPSTWTGWGRDGNGDGVRDPFNVFDAAAAAADYLCAAGRDLGTYRGQLAAVLSYNHSDAYVSEVLGLEKIYASGAVGVTIPVLPTTPDPATVKSVGKPTLPPVDPGPPRALIPPKKPKPTTPSPGASTSGSAVVPSGGAPSTVPDLPSSDPPSDPTSDPTNPTSGDPTSTPPDESSPVPTDPGGESSTDEPSTTDPGDPTTP
jgi:membrane-bound lytic murein transglycosylase B